MDSEPTNGKLFCVNQQHASIHQPTQHVLVPVGLVKVVDGRPDIHIYSIYIKRRGFPRPKDCLWATRLKWKPADKPGTVVLDWITTEGDRKIINSEAQYQETWRRHHWDAVCDNMLRVYTVSR